MVRYKTVRQFSAESGYTEAAIRTKVQDGTWPEGLVYVRAPDNRILISVEGYAEWVESGAAFAPHQKAVLKSLSSMKVSSAASVSRLSPRPLI